MTTTTFDDAANVKITRDGFLVARPRVAKAGVELCDYTAHGHGWLRVYRPKDELFKPDTLASLANKPITLDHPPMSDPVNANNWKRMAVGTTGGVNDVLIDGASARISVLLMDEAAIRAVQSGTRQLSFAHTGTITPCSGVSPEGEQYDAIQTDITFTDHLAIVDEARGGPELSIGDSFGGISPRAIATPTNQFIKGDNMSFHPRFSDGSSDFTSPHRPGYRFLDNADPDRTAANDAYETMRTRLSDGWRNKRVLTPEKSAVTPPRIPSLDQLQAAATQAWEQRNERMRTAWKTSKEA